MSYAYNVTGRVPNDVSFWDVDSHTVINIKDQHHSRKLIPSSLS